VPDGPKARAAAALHRRETGRAAPIIDPGCGVEASLKHVSGVHLDDEGLQGVE
jgi:hypothetical protein